MSRRLPTTLGTVLALALTAPLLAQPAATAQSAPREVPVVWVIGNSNAEGATSGYWLSNPLEPGNIFWFLAWQPWMQMWWPGASTQRPNSVAGWEEYKVGSIFPENNGSWWMVEGVFGPEASIGGAARAHFQEVVYVFKYAKIAAFDPRFHTTWAKRPSGVGTYADMFREWRKCESRLKARGLSPVVRGITLISGEGDAFAPFGDRLDFARNYATNLTQWIADVRADLAPGPHPQPIPVAQSQLHQRHVPRNVWTQPEILIRAAQAQVAQQDARVTLTGTDSLTLDPSQNSVHFDAIGSLKLGFMVFQDLVTVMH